MAESGMDDREFVENRNTQKIEANSDLNIASNQFNPLVALYATEYKVCSRKPKIIYQNIAAFESAFKKFGILKLNCKNVNGPQKDDRNVSKPTGCVTKREEDSVYGDAETTRRFLPHQMPLQRPIVLKHRHQRNILSQISSIEGPLSRLWYCVQNQLSVRVSLRTQHGIQGLVVGRLKFFDKHWNMILEDVFETWKRRKYSYGENKICGNSENCTNRLMALGIQLPTQTVKSLDRKNIEITRKLAQLLVRGDKVVLVALVTANK